jgi:hypothetical protein
VIPKIPEDVMTLVPPAESGNTTIKSLDNRRVYEVIGDGGQSSLTDFEGRAVARTANSLKISGGPAARVTVRWRFGSIASATVNGAPVQVKSAPDASPSIEFDFGGEAATVEWQNGLPPAQVAPPPPPPVPANPVAAPVAAPVAPPVAVRHTRQRGTTAAKTRTRSSTHTTAHRRTRSRRCRRKPCPAPKSSSGKPSN